MQKSRMLACVALLVASSALYAVEMAQEFQQALDALEVSGGKDENLQKKLCGIGVSYLNQLREKVLSKFPALQAKKNKAEQDLGLVTRELQKVKKDSKKWRQLTEKKEMILLDLKEIENEVEAQLHDDSNLAAQFDHVQSILKEWCE